MSEIVMCVNGILENADTDRRTRTHGLDGQ